MENILKKCFAIDYSGSTSGESFYHDNVKKILDQKYKDNDDIIIWESGAKYISYEDYMEINKNRKGSGGTYPSRIISFLKNKEKVHYSEFILISDGEVGQYEVESCDKEFESCKNIFSYDYAEIYLIGRKSCVNLSVACPFTRVCPSKTILKSPDEEDKIIAEISKDDLNIVEKINSISTESEFNKHFDSLKKACIARFIGTNGDIEIRKSLLLMQKRIIKNNAEK